MTPDEFQFLASDTARLGVEPMPVRRRTFGPENDSLSALSWGDAEPSTVYLHGAGLHAHSWDSVILALGEPAVAFDLPGHGDSPWRPDFDYRPATIAAGTAAAIDSACTSGAALVGQSLGGLTAIEVARRLSHRITHLALVDISPGRRTEHSRSSGIGEFMRGPESYRSRDEMIDRALAFGIGTSRESLARGVELNTRMRPDGRFTFKHHLAHPPAGQSMPAYNAADFWPALESLSVPILLVYGTRGVLSSDDVAEFQQRLPQAAVAEIEAGHNVQRDAPLELAQALRNFFQSPTAPHHP